MGGIGTEMNEGRCVGLSDFFEKTGVVNCPKCGEEIEFDIDNDTIICPECEAMLLISDYDDEHGYSACVV
jgi:DNA-directed RNA polymerase subunit RPC12/RpoP